MQNPAIAYNRHFTVASMTPALAGPQGARGGVPGGHAEVSSFEEAQVTKPCLA